MFVCIYIYIIIYVHTHTYIQLHYYIVTLYYVILLHCYPQEHDPQAASNVARGHATLGINGAPLTAAAPSEPNDIVIIIIMILVITMILITHMIMMIGIIMIIIIIIIMIIFIVVIIIILMIMTIVMITYFWLKLFVAQGEVRHCSTSSSSASSTADPLAFQT